MKWQDKEAWIQRKWLKETRWKNGFKEKLKQ